MKSLFPNQCPSLKPEIICLSWPSVLRNNLVISQVSVAHCRTRHKKLSSGGLIGILRYGAHGILCLFLPFIVSSIVPCVVPRHHEVFQRFIWYCRSKLVLGMNLPSADKSHTAVGESLRYARYSLFGGIRVRRVLERSAFACSNPSL